MGVEIPTISSVFNLSRTLKSPKISVGVLQGVLQRIKRCVTNI